MHIWVWPSDCCVVPVAEWTPSGHSFLLVLPNIVQVTSSLCYYRSEDHGRRGHRRGRASDDQLSLASHEHSPTLKNILVPAFYFVFSSCSSCKSILRSIGFGFHFLSVPYLESFFVHSTDLRLSTRASYQPLHIYRIFALRWCIDSGGALVSQMTSFFLFCASLGTPRFSLAGVELVWSSAQGSRSDKETCETKVERLRKSNPFPSLKPRLKQSLLMKIYCRTLWLIGWLVLVVPFGLVVWLFFWCCGARGGQIAAIELLAISCRCAWSCSCLSWLLH